MGKELQTLALENTLDEILACQAAEIDALTQRGDTPEKIVSIQRDILRILEVFAEQVQYAEVVVNKSDTVS
jgi:hypothetical protein